MEQQDQAIFTAELSEQITACTLSKADLKTLCEILQQSSSEAAAEEIRHYNPLNRSPEQIQADIASLREGFQIKVNVQGVDDAAVYGSIPVVFNSPRFPDKVKSLYINSDLNLRNLYNWIPRNRFELFLDFNKPEPFNLLLSPSESTPNSSIIRVSGQNETWVNGVFRTVTVFVRKRKSRFRFFHVRHAYDLLALCMGFPFAFWMAYRLSSWINSMFGTFSIFVQNGAYVFLFLVSLNIFRILFDYARWTFPTVEYNTATNSARKHRYVLGVLALAVFGNFIYDMCKIAITLLR